MKRTVFVGTYTNGESEGIYSCRFDGETGAIDGLRLAAKTASPSFLALHPNRNLLYAVNETQEYKDKKTGSITAFEITDVEGGDLKELNIKSTHGASPCHLAIAPEGNSVIIANYHGGTVCARRIKDDGSLGKTLNAIKHEGSSVNKSRQKAPHPHAISIDPAGKFVFVADLGLDHIVKYGLKDTGRLSLLDESTEVAPGSGPRHFAFHPSGRFAYVINELLRTVTAFTYDAGTGDLKEIQTISTVPEGWEKGSTAEIFAHPNGKFLYGSNRGHDSIACYKIDDGSGKLTLVEIVKTGGKTPRNFNIDPDGKFVIAANQATNDVHVFSVNQETGALEPAAGRLEVPTPVCVVFAG